MIKSVEICYDIDSIPRSVFLPKRVSVLTFRNKAMTRIEEALHGAGVGEWGGAEIGGGEVNFGFRVNDFEKAEALIRGAVKGTKYATLREIRRKELDPAEYP